MLTIKIQIAEEARREIKNIYGKDDYETVASAAYDIINRYMNIEHFDPKMYLENNSDYAICESCGEKAKHNRMVDVDGKHLEECSVCENCGSGYPALN